MGYATRRDSFHEERIGFTTPTPDVNETNPTAASVPLAPGVRVWSPGRASLEKPGEPAVAPLSTFARGPTPLERSA
jgi:hypothetical protein